MYASIGKCCISTTEASTSQAILGIRTKNSLSEVFLYYYLSYFQHEIANQGQQGTQSNLNKGMVQNLSIGLPKKQEQTAIANILSDMDQEIETLEKKKEKYQQIKKGMMQQLLTGKIRLIDNKQWTMDNG
jgi:type I restriction enzyme S subunit